MKLRSKRLPGAMFALIALLTASAETLSAQEIPHERYTLDNGLTVILHRDTRVPIVAVNIWYAVGSKDEPAGRSGFAHLFEHLMFMGTRNVPRGEFDRTMESHGGSNNATTSQDRTNYFESGPSNLLETLLFLEADRLRTLGADTDQEKLDLQRDVVRNERRQNYENRPYGKAFLEMWPALFPKGHPYHTTVIGSHEDLENASVEDVRSFFATFYVPVNGTLVVAGDFDTEQAKRWIEKHFGSIPEGEKPKHADAEPVSLETSKIVTLEDRVRLPRTMLLFHSPAFYKAGDAELDVLSTVLGSGKTGRLYKRLVHEKQMAQDVSASQWSSALGSLFVITCTARPGVELESIEKEILSVIAELEKSPPTERECQRARNSIESMFWSSLESVAERADLLNRYQFHFDDPGAIKKDLARYEAVTPRGVLEWARKTLGANRVTLRIVPRTETKATETGEASEEAGKKK